MRIRAAIALAATVLAWPVGLRAEDITARVRKAVERSTLDQPGTKPFHLKAELAPSLERDKDLGLNGEVEIWWAAPDKWRREVRSPAFHQIEIVNGTQDWQKNEGEYFPEWLREISVALIRPVPDLDGLLHRVESADEKNLMGSTYLQWHTVGSDGTVSKGIGASFAISDNTGLEFYGGDIGWCGLFKDYWDFHGRTVARAVSCGSPETTAKVVVLENLKGTPDDFFDAAAKGGDPEPLHTAVLDELALRKNLVPAGAPEWPPLENGPVEGVSIAKVAVDRKGNVHLLGKAVTDNPGVSDTYQKYVEQMHFRPYLVGGSPAQVVSTITLPFKTVRPAAAEQFDTAKNYFDHARTLGFPAAAASAPYVLKAEFTTRSGDGIVVKGKYTDTWVSATQWRREADFGVSRFIRSQNGDTRYLLFEGPDVAVLRSVLTFMEPLPATDTFTESDWRIKRDTADGEVTIRVARGYESSDGTPDPRQFNAYWFNESGQLVRTYQGGAETRRTAFAVSDGIDFARRVDVLIKGKLGMTIDVTAFGPAGSIDPGMFIVKGHEWVRQFTAEVR